MKIFWSLFKVFSSVGTLTVLYLIYALLDSHDLDLIRMSALVIIHPIIGLGIASFTVLLVWLVSTPLRSNSRIGSWWKKHDYLSLLLIFIGFLISGIAFLPAFKETAHYFINEVDEPVILQQPNLFMIVLGWLLIPLGIMNLPISRLISKLFRKFF